MGLSALNPPTSFPNPSCTPSFLAPTSRKREPWFVAADVCAHFYVTNRNRVLQQVDESDKGGTQMDTLVAADVCKALNIGNPKQAIVRLDDDEKMTTLISNEGHSGQRGGGTRQASKHDREILPDAKKGMKMPFGIARSIRFATRSPLEGDAQSWQIDSSCSLMHTLYERYRAKSEECQ